MTSMTPTARVLALALFTGGTLGSTSPVWAQTAPVAPPPATSPVDPLPPAGTAPPPLGSGTPAVASDPYAASAGTTGAWDAPPPPPPAPIYDQWWFWTGIGALAVIGVVVAVAASGDKTPSTYFGNGRAF